jgi:hypothetical protein
MKQDIFLRAHTVGPQKKESRPANGPKWPKEILVFDTETTIDTRQELTFGAYCLCELVDGQYACSEEGLFYADGPSAQQRKVLEQYVERQQAQIAVKTFPPKLDLKLYPRWKFVEQVFWKAIKDERMIVGFNLPFDLSRLAVDWAKADNGGWSLILSQRRSRKTGMMEPNPYKPRVRITAKDSKSAFIALTKPQKPEEWPEQCRFLDVHTLAFALYSESLSLDNLCNRLNIPGKLKHDPTGKVMIPEVDYCRGDVRATVGALNELKQEFDQHPLDLHPDRAHSPASIAKAYLHAMRVVPPQLKFDVPNRILGIAMQAYYGGRAECRIRHTPVPVVHTDFKSQYPTVNALLGNWDVLTAESVDFDDVTDEVRQLLSTVTMKVAFDPDFWKKLGFFALVVPDRDIFPVRAVYNGETQNIGVNEFTSERPIWFAGPDVIASILLAGKVPRIDKAIRMVPHGRQAGLKSTSLRGILEIDPERDDFFRSVIEQRTRNKSNKPLQYFLKILANAGSYGLFVEVTPEKKHQPVSIEVFCGEESFKQQTLTVENQGLWYFPPITALITAGGRLLLAMLERSVTNANGSYLFCDTDSLCIVSSEKGGAVDCEQSQAHHSIKALSWKQVRDITRQFRRLNPYDPEIVRDLLKVEDVNFDSAGKQRQLFGYAISAKRYALHLYDKDNITIIDPKAHGLGYLYPPTEKNAEAEQEWTFAAWNWLLRGALGLPTTAPAWLDRPAMMRIAMSTPHVLERLNRATRPYNFVFCPLIDSVAGYPVGVDPEHFTLMTPFTKKLLAWLNADYINIYDGKHYEMALEQTPRLDKVIPQTFGYILRLYPLHPESKSLAPDGTPCIGNTRGLLQRAHVIAARPRYIGKETDRKWDHGEGLTLLTFSPTEFDAVGRMVKADGALIKKLAAVPVKEVVRKTGIDRNTVRKILRGSPVRRATLQRVAFALGTES